MVLLVDGLGKHHHYNLAPLRLPPTGQHPLWTDRLVDYNAGLCSSVSNVLPEGEVTMAERIAEWVEQLGAGDAETRRRAAEQLARSSQIQEALIPLVRAAGDSDDQVREWVAACLEEAEAPDREELASLVHLLADPQTDVSYWAATLIGRLGPDARGAGDSLAEALASHPAMAVRQRAAWALGKVGASTPLARQRLQQAARGEDARLARLAQRALDE